MIFNNVSFQRPHLFVAHATAITDYLHTWPVDSAAYVHILAKINLVRCDLPISQLSRPSLSLEQHRVGFQAVL